MQKYLQISGVLLMTRCEFCNIEINDNLTICPLCFKSLKLIMRQQYPEYPKYKKLDYTLLSFGLKIILFIFISVSSISLIINLLLWQGIPWFILVISSLLYIWLSIKNTIVSKANYGAKIILQLLGLSLLLIIIDFVNKNLSWSVNYVIPLVIIIANMVMTLRIATKSIKWRNYSVFLIILLFIGFIPITLFLLNLITVLWPSVAAFLNTLLTFLGFIIFYSKRFRLELLKIFHL